MPTFDYKNIQSVFHIGHLSGKEARKPSLDGPGLSVTTTPESWRQIKGLNGPQYTLSFPSAQWVNAMALSEGDFDEIRKWAAHLGYIKKVNAWHAYIDVQGDLLPKAFPSRDDALKAIGRDPKDEAAGEETGNVATWLEETHRVTGKGLKLLERWPGTWESWEQAAILLYVQQVVLPKRPYVVGVWWSEPDRPDAGVAPSGILLPERLHFFEVEDEDLNIQPFKEAFPDVDTPDDPFIGWS